MYGPLGAKQRGVALILVAAILGIGICAFVVTALNSAVLNEATLVRNRNAEVLQQAKTALIGHVAKQVLNLSESVPGRLPCPESAADAGTTNEGTEAATCGDPLFPAQQTVGRLPWRTLGLDKLVDGASEPLWYAVSPNWVTAAAAPVINGGTPGQLTIDAIGGVVAVIIAPGRPLTINPNANQLAAGCMARQQARNDRSHVAASVANPDYRDYLECENGSNPIDAVFAGSVADNATNPVLNDQVVTITATELLNAIQGPLAERLQRTVAPLLSEYSDLWPGGNFSPYAVAFVTPENPVFDLAQQCGPSATAPQQTEGLLPLAPNAAACASPWGAFSVSGSGSLVNCVMLVSTNVRCNFRYYQLVGLGLLLGPSASADVTIQATAPHAAASFRTPLVPSDVITPAGVSVLSVALNPQTDGDARLALEVRITGTNLCNNLIVGLLCNLLPGLLATPVDTSVEFPQLAATTVLQGTKLSPNVKAVHPGPGYNLHSPAVTAPHYWFMQNQWYRYTYYAVSPGASAAAAGGNFTVNGFPVANGASTNKRFVLIAMGPQLTGQVRGPAAALSQYVEGANAASAAAPRVFAYQVYAQSGNDRLATCPFNDGTATPCD